MCLHRTLITFTCLSAVFALSLPAAAATIKVATNVADSSNWVRGLDRFKELVEERSGGRHIVELYPNGVLSGGNDHVELEMVQAGAIEMIMTSTPWLARLDDDFMVIAMPWIFPNAGVALAVMDGPLGEHFSGILETKSLHPLAWGDGSFLQLYSNRGPITSPADVAGVKIRTPRLELYLDSWRAVGAVPVAISFAKALSALKGGAIDGGISPISAIYSSRFFEVSKNIAVINFSFESPGLIASDVFWSSLSTEDQELIRQAAKEGMQYQREVAAGEEAELVEKMEAAGVTVQTPSAEQLAEFKAKVQPVYDAYKQQIGAELVDQVEAEVQEYAGN